MVYTDRHIPNDIDFPRDRELNFLAESARCCAEALFGISLLRALFDLFTEAVLGIRLADGFDAEDCDSSSACKAFLF